MNPSPDIARYCEAADAAFDWCVRDAYSAAQSADHESAARWAQIAGRIAVRFGHSHLTAATLEGLLASLGKKLFSALPQRLVRSAPRRRRWVHVLSLSLEIGGHTALAMRWIEHNPFGDIHSLVLTHQRIEDAAARIRGPVERSGGKLISLAAEASLLARAARLREFASAEADVIVLHIHPWDVIPSIAFASPGGPPVLFVNHYDHGFWIGAGCPDLVIDIRESGQHLTRTLRGIDRTVILPVPLPDPGCLPHSRLRAAERAASRALLDAGIVLLTIGQEHKYRPIRGLHFQVALHEIVNQVDDCVAVAVGPKRDDSEWQNLARKTGGRVIAVGPDPDLRPWHEAADVYLEGFPIGSYTALLETALAGRPFVRKPYLVSPAVLPIDRGALASFEPPPTVDDYVAMAIELCNRADRREAMAEKARTDVRSTHCGNGWASHLENVLKRIPTLHQPATELSSLPLPDELAHYWAEIHEGTAQRGPMQVARRLAAEAGLSPAV